MNDIPVPLAASRFPVTVVKLGGSLLEDEGLRTSALRALAARATAGERLVVVHGGGKRIDGFLVKLGMPRKVHRGLRVTDGATLDVVVAVLAGLVNKSLVAELRALGVRAAGISGVDGETLWAEYHLSPDGVDLGYVGSVTASDTTLVNAILDAGLLPVVASIAMGREGTLLNVNADSAASALAGALAAERLVFLTDVEGLLDGEGHLVESLPSNEAKGLLAGTAVSGGMRPKLEACLSAIAHGVKSVVIAGPSRHTSVFLDGKGGTCLVAA